MSLESVNMAVISNLLSDYINRSVESEMPSQSILQNRLTLEVDVGSLWAHNVL